MKQIIIDVMATMLVILLVLVFYYYRKAKNLLIELQKKTLEAANLDAMLQAAELRADAENKTAEERRKLIDDLTFATRGVRPKPKP